VPGFLLLLTLLEEQTWTLKHKNHPALNQTPLAKLNRIGHKPFAASICKRCSGNSNNINSNYGSCANKPSDDDV
jgi:hypothetical protein